MYLWENLPHHPHIGNLLVSQIFTPSWDCQLNQPPPTPQDRFSSRAAWTGQRAFGNVYQLGPVYLGETDRRLKSFTTSFWLRESKHSLPTLSIWFLFWTFPSLKNVHLCEGCPHPFQFLLLFLVKLKSELNKNYNFRRRGGETALKLSSGLSRWVKTWCFERSLWRTSLINESHLLSKS